MGLSLTQPTMEIGDIEGQDIEGQDIEGQDIEANR